MKKALLFSFFIFIFSITLWAQPNITVNNFPFIERAIYQPVDSSTVAGFGTIVNTFWDFGSVQQKGAHRTVYYTQVSNHPMFTTATEKTEAWIMFDDTNVYVSARIWDSAPESQWVANEMRRDTSQLRQNDTFAVFFDTFYDRRNGYNFYKWF